MRLRDTLLVAVASCLYAVPFAVLAPLLPLELQGHAMGEFLQGSLLSLSSLPWLLLPPFLISWLAPRAGLLRATQIATFLLFLSVVAYAFAHAWPSPLATLMARLLHAVGSSAALTGYLAFLSDLDPERAARSATAATRSCGSQAGFALGLTLTELLHSTLGSNGVFLLVALLTLSILAILQRLSRYSPPSTKVGELRAPRSTASLLAVLSAPAAAMRVGIAVINSILLNALHPTFAEPLNLKLASTFALSSGTVELFSNAFVASLLVGCLCSLLLVRFTSKHILISMGSFLAAIGLFLLGPSALLGLPSSPELVLAGLVLCGFGKALAVGLLLPEMVEIGL